MSFALDKIKNLYLKEEWEIKGDKVIAFGQEFEVGKHPFRIYSHFYRHEKVDDLKYTYLKKMHDFLWPHHLWHYWTERRFKRFCEGEWQCITWAAGASTSKSYDAAKLGILFWLANPQQRAVIVASTSLESAEARIYGYVLSHLKDSALPNLPLNILSSKPAKILYKNKFEPTKYEKDPQHGIFAVAAKEGDDERTISSWIGRHPKEALFVILDECTDMPPAILSAKANLDTSTEFKMLGIGNSSSKFDLHGAMSTPKNGWETINPEVDYEWPTTQPRGLCMYFSPYDSPAIHEKDPIRQEKLSRFLITSYQIENKGKVYGKDSDSFWRFVMGFWRETSTEDNVVSALFLNEFGVRKRVEWSGLYPLNVVAGLDPAFSTGGDGCVLQLGILGVNTEGLVCLDFAENELTFTIKIVAHSKDSADIQIANETIRILNEYKCPLQHLCVDATGQGRALGGVLQLTNQIKNGELFRPKMIYSTRIGSSSEKSFDVIVKPAYELWFDFRPYIENRQLGGISDTALFQLSTRMVELKNGKQFLESKADYKKRMGAIMPSMARSPDEADATSLCLQSAIINFGFTPGQKKQFVKATSFESQKLQAFKMMHQTKKEEEVKKNMHVGIRRGFGVPLKVRRGFSNSK